MNRVTGSKGVKLLECVNPKYDKWRVRWDVRPEADSETTVNYMEEEFNHKPTQEEVKRLLTDWHNEQTDEKILAGFKWQGVPVWLSSENQFNYKTAYDLAVQTEGATLPVRFKFGTDDEPVFWEFYELGELKEFYLASVRHVQDALQEGWTQKQKLKLTDYE